jgi:iron complex transport system substrate-binding protein
MSARYPERIVCLTEETRVAAFLSARIDRIVELKPDLVLGFSDLQADIARELARAGLNILIFNQRSVDEILSMILTLASMVGAASKGQELVKTLEAGLQEIRAAASRFPRRPKVYFEEWDAPMISGIRWVSELVEIAGGEDIFPELSRSQAASGRVLSDHSLVIERKPDVMLASWCGKKFRPERVAARAGWQAVPAVRDQQLFEIKSADILQPGPGALTDGVRRIHEILRGFLSRGDRTLRSGGA